MIIVFPDKIELYPEHIEQIKKLGDVTLYDDVPNEDEVIKRIQGAELITANYIDITRRIIESSPSLKYIIVPSVGYDWVDVKAATEANVKVINCPTHNGHAVAELTIGLMFAVARNIVQANMSLKNEEWRPRSLTGVELRGKLLGLLGYGNIGRQTAKLAQDLGMTVIHANSSASSKELDELIAAADFVCLNLPLTEHTRHLIDERRLKLMKKTAFLINTARGAIVDQKALEQVLKDKGIAGAALDVFENEPLTGQPIPEMLEIVMLENVVATPHIGYNTQETFQRMGTEIIENIESCINGQPINIVNK